MSIINGRVWRFPAGVTTDDILPGVYLDRANDEVGKFAMAGIDPDFINKISSGDIIVAGANFGMGSGRESAPIALKLAGISAVVATSFARTYFRNSINIGLPAVMIENGTKINQGDLITIDLESQIVSTAEEKYSINNLSGISLEILQAGGIVAYTKARMASKKVPLG